MARLNSLDCYRSLGVIQQLRTDPCSVELRDLDAFNDYIFQGSVAGGRRYYGYGVDHIITICHFAEDSMIPVKPWGCFYGDEELATVGVGA